MSWTLLPLGLLIGFLMGLTGFTGAVVVPILTLGFGFAQARAQATSMALLLAPTQWPAIWQYHRDGKIDWPMVLWLLPGAIVGTWLGARCAVALPPTVLRTAFAGSMVYVGAYLLLAMATPSAPKAIGGAVVLTGITGAMWFGLRVIETRASV